MRYNYLFGGYRSLGWLIRRRSLFWNQQQKSVFWVGVSLSIISSFVAFSNMLVNPFMYYSTLIGFIVILSYSFSSIMDSVEGGDTDEEV